MIGSLRAFHILVFLTLAPHVAAALEEPTPATRIPSSRIAAMQAKATKIRSSRLSRVEKRRAFKSIARQGAALVEEYSTSPDRFRVLGIMLQCRKALLDLERTDRSREALFLTCAELAKAPDEYAGVRLEADMILSDRDLSGRNASVEERAEALREILARYRGTSAEAKSLMISSVVARNLGATQLGYDIVDIMDERFSDDMEVISFRRKHLTFKTMILKFKGKYARPDGTTLFLPADRIGHHCFMVYWSSKRPGFETFLKQVDEHRDRHPDMFDFYSFNLDDLPDAGEEILRDLGLDWQVLHLPGGKKNLAFSALDADDPLALFVNAYGYTRLKPGSFQSDATTGMRGRYTQIFSCSDSRISHDRYLAQMQSLLIGDFLVVGDETTLNPSMPPEMKMTADAEADDSELKLPRSDRSVPTEVLSAIHACFTPPPLRYRLTRKEALANYRKAEKLCAEAIEKHPVAPDLWLVRNRRIIALLGMWNISCEARHLAQAGEEAKATLAMTLPRGGDVVSRFCLSKAALRCEEPDPESVLPAFLKDAGGSKAPDSAYAACAILALEANSRQVHEQCRSHLLGRLGGGSPSLWSFTSFLRDRYHRYHLLVPNYLRHEGPSFRTYIVNHTSEPMTDRFPEMELKTLEGEPLQLPGDTGAKPTLLLFIEPPADPDADFSVVKDRQGKPTTNDSIRTVMGYASQVAGAHIHGGVEVIAAFLTDNAAHVKSLMSKNKWTCRPAMVPGGVTNPVVNRLGILSADRMPNVFLLRRDGTVAWTTSGLAYKAEFGYPFAVWLAMKVHVEVCEIERAYAALAKGDYGEAARIFAGPFLPAEPDRYGWRPPRHHGRALAHMGMKDWDGALEAIDIAIDAYKLCYFRGRRRWRAHQWRTAAKRIIVKEITGTHAEMFVTKAIILEKLERGTEAADLCKRAASPGREERDSVYKAFHNRLREFRLARTW